MQLSKRVRLNSSKQSAAKHKAKQNRSKRAPFFFFSGEEGVLLTVCLQLRAKRSRASPSFASCYALATAEGRPAPVCLQLLAQRRRNPHLPHCTLEVAALRAGLSGAVAPHVFKFTFSRRESRWVKFANLAKFDFKFEHKTIRRSIFSFYFAQALVTRLRYEETRRK